ncbi:MAG: amidohydrolase family protein [Candidatus Heimdallarchaeota archaeon]|nr:MAG: amidohydrolase family protein [Candidatus Heimdallarchaeota archaeon]
MTEGFQHLPTIDFHTHLPLSPVQFFTSDIKVLPSFDEFLTALNTAHVTEAVLFCGPKKGPMRSENEKLAQQIQSLKKRFVLMAWLNPKQDTVTDLQELVEEHDFRGLKLHPVFDKYHLSEAEVTPFITKAIELEVPILIHSGWGPEGSVEDIGKLAEEHPEGTFVCCHMKEEFGLNDRFSHIELAARLTNVYLECSYIPHPRRLADAVDMLGPERILFGSDYPWGAQNVNWEKTKVTSAPISFSEKKQILHENARELLKL